MFRKLNWIILIRASHKMATKCKNSNIVVEGTENVLCRKVIKLKSEGGSGVALDKATKILNDDGVVALPTDTIYGLAGLAQSTTAVEKIYSVKERHNEKPLSICVGSIDDVSKWAEVYCEITLLKDLFPGPVTLLFKRSPDLNPNLNPGVSNIGIRIPDHAFIRALCIACDSPLALTSANASAAMSTLKVEEFKYLWPKIDLVIDGGLIEGDKPKGRENVISDDDSEASPFKKQKKELSEASSSNSTSSHSKPLSREGSTIVDLSKPGRYKILREGSALESTMTILHRHGLEEEI